MSKTPEEWKIAIAEMLLKTESIQIYQERPFVFVSGRISPVYIDCRKLLSFPDVREAIVDQMAKTVEKEIGLDVVDVVAGGETSGAVVQALGVQLLQIGAQIDPGVPATVSSGAQPLALALKSGNFGGRDFFSKALKQLAGASA